MLINVRVNDEKQALEFINNVLRELGEEEVQRPVYTNKKIQIAPELRTKHVSEGPKDITIESYRNLAVTVDDLDYKTQEIVNKYKNRLHRL